MIKNKLLVFFALLLTASITTQAHSAPRAQVAIENYLDNPIDMSPVEYGIFITQYYTEDLSMGALQSGEGYEFKVGNLLGLDKVEFTINYYEKKPGLLNRKKCSFTASNNAKKLPSGKTEYHWTHNSTGENNAICRTEIISEDQSTGDWEIKFVME